MKKEIVFEDFKNSGYDKKGITNYKLIDGSCGECGSKFEYSSVKKFLRNREFKHIEEWQRCSKCWLRFKTSENPEWIEKNRQAQLIAQNKPEQKRKNAEGVSKSWTKERKKKASTHLKKRWNNDDCFKKKALENLSWTQKNNDRFQQIMVKSIGSGGLKGKYNGIYYDSALELSFILWCENSNIRIKRYDEPPIKYIDENGIERLYFPDYIIKKDTIVEIKGEGLYYRKNYERNIRKIKKLKSLKRETLILFGSDKIIKKNYNRARRLHHANKEKENN